MQRDDGIFICQQRYALESLRRFGMMESNEVTGRIVPGFKVNKDKGETTIDDVYFKQLVISLIYFTATKPDIMCGTGLISRYMVKPTNLHL